MATQWISRDTFMQRAYMAIQWIILDTFILRAYMSIQWVILDSIIQKVHMDSQSIDNFTQSSPGHPPDLLMIHIFSLFTAH